MTSETERVDQSANWYLSKQLDLDRRLTGFNFRWMEPYLTGRNCLELGSGDGVMTRLLAERFERLSVVEGSAELLSSLPDLPNLAKVHSLFEDFRPAEAFDVVVMEHVLEHVEDPVAILRLAKPWLAPGARVFVGVPNAHSFHRLAAVKMGLLNDAYELNARDHAVGHRRVYDWGAMRRDIEAAGFEIELMTGLFFKPLSNGQIEQYWTEQMIEGFFQLGADFPENAAEIKAICRLPVGPV